MNTTASTESDYALLNDSISHMEDIGNLMLATSAELRLHAVGITQNAQKIESQFARHEA